MMLQFLWMKTAPRHNRVQRGQHRVFPSRRTDATRPGEWAHKSSQGPTRAFAVLGCSISIHCRQTVIGRERPGKNLPTAFKFSELLGGASACRRGWLYDYSVVKFSHWFFQKINFSGKVFFLLLYVLLIYFLLISWRGSPPPDGGRDELHGGLQCQSTAGRREFFLCCS